MIYIQMRLTGALEAKVEEFKAARGIPRATDALRAMILESDIRPPIMARPAAAARAYSDASERAGGEG